MIDNDQLMDTTLEQQPKQTSHQYQTISSSRTKSSSSPGFDFDELEFKPLDVAPIQAIPIETTTLKLHN